MFITPVTAFTASGFSTGGSLRHCGKSRSSAKARFTKICWRWRRKLFDPENTRHVIVNSEMVRREILENFSFPAGRIHLVRNGVDIARFQNGGRTETRERFGVNADDFLLLFAGSGRERKGLNFLLRAFRLLKKNNLKIKLLVVGKDHPPAVPPADAIFAGPVPDMENIYAAADLLVFPPIYEPSANVVIEALAAGRPVVTSKQNGASELIREGVNGSVVENPADIPALARAVLSGGAERCRRCRTRLI